MSILIALVNIDIKVYYQLDNVVHLQIRHLSIKKKTT